MQLEEFRREAHRLVDWMADYLAEIERHPVRAQVRPGEIASQLPAAPPDGPEPFAEIMADFERIVLPGMTHWQHPNFFAYFPANSSPPSVLAEMLTATLAAQCMLWQTSPAATEMETRLLDWLRQMIGLPEGFVGVIQDTASSATLCAILCARERATGWRANEDGLGACPPLAFYCSEEAHSSVEKAIKIAGLGRRSLRLIATDAELRHAPRPSGRRDPRGPRARAGAGRRDRHPRHDQRRRDRPAGCDRRYLPRRAASTCTSTPPGPAARCCSDEQRWMIEGIGAADSFVFNPHKWLLTNFDCTAHFVRSPDELIRTFSVLPHYLASRETDVIDYRDWGIQLGRRFRALKLWFVIRAYGVERLQAMLREHIALDRRAGRADRRRTRFRAHLARQPRFAHLPLPPARPRRSSPRRAERAPAARAERQRPPLPHPDPRTRPLRDPLRDRPAHHRAPARPAGLAADLRDRPRAEAREGSAGLTHARSAAR